MLKKVITNIMLITLASALGYITFVRYGNLIMLLGISYSHPMQAMIALIFWILCIFLVFKCVENYKNTNSIYYTLAFIVYIIFVILLLLCRPKMEIPYSSLYNFNILEIFNVNEWDASGILLVFNAVLFIPLGFINQIKYHIKFRYIFVFFIILEVTQLLTKRGICDINDILLYCLGFGIGMLIGKIYSKV